MWKVNINTMISPNIIIFIILVVRLNNVPNSIADEENIKETTNINI